MSNDFSVIRGLYHLIENNGFSAEEMLAYRNICEHLPKVLVDYYQQLGKCEFNQFQDNLLAPNELRLSQNQQFLIFYQENQLACVWAIAVSDLAKDNPPVYISYDERFESEQWQIETATLSEFLNTMAHLQSIFALPFYSEDFFAISEDELAFIQANFAKKPFKFNHWTNAEFYGNQADEVIYVDKNKGEALMTYACFGESQFDKLDQILGNFGE